VNVGGNEMMGNGMMRSKKPARQLVGRE